MTDRQSTSDGEAGKTWKERLQRATTTEEQQRLWEERLRAEDAIRQCVRNTAGNRPDLLLEKVEEKAIARWENESRGGLTPAYYAKKVLKSETEGGKDRREMPGEVADRADVADHEAQIAARERLRKLTEAQIAKLTWKEPIEVEEILPEDLSDRQLLADTGSLADRWQMRWRHTGDPRAKSMMHVLFALTDRGFGKLEDFAGSAEAHLRKTNQGPRTLQQETAGLLSTVRRCLAAQATERKTAEQIIRDLRLYPLLGAGCRVPQNGVAWPDEHRESVLQDLEQAIRRKRGRSAEDVARSAMRAVGIVSIDPKNAFPKPRKDRAKKNG